MDAVILATGSEVHLAVGAQKLLQERKISVRVVSVISQELFRAQSPDYRDSVLPPAVTRRLAVEAGRSSSWFEFTGSQGAVMGIDRFGASAPGEVVMEKYGFTASHIAERVQQLLDQ
ncbi:MAG: hypothetical protein HQL11_06775 [Candidatus Omnitrophica bacterium]|nr:hypothetical protein [Candidatus Omnitrophota bacterium]